MYECAYERAHREAAATQASWRVSTHRKCCTATDKKHTHKTRKMYTQTRTQPYGSKRREESETGKNTHSFMDCGLRRCLSSELLSQRNRFGEQTRIAGATDIGTAADKRSTKDTEKTYTRHPHSPVQ